MKWVREDLVSKRMRLYDKGRSFCVRPKVLTIYAGRKTENKKKQKKKRGKKEILVGNLNGMYHSVI